MSKLYSDLYRKCMTCGTIKYATEFYVRDKKTGRRHSICKECDKKRVKERYEADPSKYKNQHLKRNYGITLNEYNQMLVDQNHKCITCGTTEPGGKHGKFMVDHCHTTGKVRGLLCKKCNIALGEVGDNISTLETMIAYLNKHQ